MNRMFLLAAGVIAAFALVVPPLAQTPQQEAPQSSAAPAPQGQTAPQVPPPPPPGKPLLPPAKPYTGPVGGPPFAGRWDSDWGVLQIEVKDGKATGQYEFRQGRIEGEVSADGKTLTGTWVQAPGYALGDDGGHFSFTLTPNQKSFEGLLWRGQDKSGEPREFIAIMTHPPASAQNPTRPPAPPPEKAATMAGTWESDWGAMELEVEGAKATGTFAWNSGRIEGTLSKYGHRFVGTWRKAPTYEPGADGGLLLLMMDREGGVLRGQYWNGDKKSGTGQPLVAVRAKAPGPIPAAPPAGSEGAGGVSSQPGG